MAEQYKRNTPHTLASLLERTYKDGDCLIWVGASIRKNQYGVTTFNGKQTTVHRIVYQLANNVEIPEGFEVDHVCNVRKCVNPKHLVMCTHEENMTAGRLRRTTCRAGHEWTDANTYVTRVKRKQGGYREQRYCRLCRAKHQQDLRTRNEPHSRCSFVQCTNNRR